MEGKEFLEPFVDNISVNKYSIHFDEDVTSADYYRLVVETLVNATENDVIYMYFSSNGGSLDSMITILSAMQMCRAPLYGHLMSNCYSAASAIFLACDFHYVGYLGSMMIHRGSVGYSGNVNNVEEFIDFSREQGSLIFDLVYSDFLSDEDMAKVKSGSDLFLNAKEVSARLELMNANKEEEVVH